MALITLAEVKTLLSITTTTKDDIFNALIASADAAVKKYVDRIIEADDLTEYHDGESADTIALKEYPIISVTSVHDDIGRTFGASSLIASDDYVTDDGQGTLRLIGRGLFADGQLNVKVIYRAGYEDADVPEDIKHAAKKLVAHWFNLRQQSGYSSKTMQDGSSTFDFNHEIPTDVKAILNPYRRLQAI